MLTALWTGTERIRETPTADALTTTTPREPATIGIARPLSEQVDDEPTAMTPLSPGTASHAAPGTGLKVPFGGAT